LVFSEGWSFAPPILSFSGGGKRENAPCTVEERKSDAPGVRCSSPYVFSPRRGAVREWVVNEWIARLFPLTLPWLISCGVDEKKG